jgi:hypothetical protein
MTSAIEKCMALNEAMLILTHYRGNLWVVEKYHVNTKELLYRKQHGCRAVSGEADARADYERHAAVVYATCALHDKPLDIKELK